MRGGEGGAVFQKSPPFPPEASDLITGVNNGDGKIVNPDRTVYPIDYSIADYYFWLYGCIAKIVLERDKHRIENEFKEEKRIDEIDERSKILSLYFYGPLIMLLLLTIKRYRVQAASLYYLIMPFLFGQMFMLEGVFFNIYSLTSHPQGAFIRIVQFILFVFFAKALVNGIKNIKRLDFHEVSIVIFFIILPFNLYF